MTAVRSHDTRAPGGSRRPARRPLASAQSLTDRAYAVLEEMIVTLQLPPTAVVSEATLSEQLGIGRTPIREALQRLARERLVIVLPRRGIIVSQVDVRSQLRLLEVRREIERLVARSAAREATERERQKFADLAAGFDTSARDDDETMFMRTDRAFNELCLVAARNEYATGAMSLMHALSRRFWFIRNKQTADMPRAAALHAAVARAIANADETGAAQSSDLLLDYIEGFTRSALETAG
jgi:DNA-binding GntR family transcriptional regulator